MRSSGSPIATDTIRALPREEVDAFVIDLDRLPSQGRDVGVTLRRAKSSRYVALVFAGGAPEKVGARARTPAGCDLRRLG